MFDNMEIWGKIEYASSWVGSKEIKTVTIAVTNRLFPELWDPFQGIFFLFWT